MSLVVLASTSHPFQKAFATFLLVIGVVFVTFLVVIGISELRARRRRRGQ